ncbi:O-antigen ligase family protein [Porphyromonas circumdentaria]|uniref:O-antigen ligase n=1 Tax=Porphyromonas circumdentaria TaxID=29524 RepID=A0A1T4P0Y3_9PORP|nr:hypothetical protein [Porphyromonas circumdentaria]MBB6276263.1 hypothetical protein [Porphyromonas circumdentaria]SJZ85111.1 hypothetical protein SAMN02745171_01297 [Porphyromonas circumdentaria]
MKQTKNLLLSYTLYFRLLPLLFGIGGVLLPLLSPHLFEKEIALDRLDITHFALPFWIFISLAGALILYQFLAEVQAKTEKRAHLNEEGTLLFWSLGYANLLFGVINSHLGILFFFILGAITNCIPYFRNGFKGLLRPKLFLIATTAYVAYEALTLLWSDNALQSLTYWQKEIWIAIVPLLMCIAPPSGYTVRRFMKYALQISYLYLLSQLLIYGWTCLSIENPLWAAFSFNKAYFTISGEAMFPGFLLSLLGFDHYTYLGFVFLAPILYFLTEHILKSSNRHSWEIISLVSLAAISYSFIHQSRTLMLFYLFIALIVIVRKKNGWGYKRVVASSIVGLGVILGVLLYFYPHLLHFFVDTHRLELLRVARNYLGDNLLNGYGLGSSENLIYPFFNGAKHTAHFHNQFIQSLLEGGVVSGLLVALIPISYGIESYRQKNGASLFLILLFSLIMVIDLVVFLTEYLIAMLLLLSIMIHGTSTKATE